MTAAPYAPTYTTTAKVAAQLQCSKFTADTKPSEEDVKELIRQKEDEIDFNTGSAWRTRFSQSESGQDTASTDFEFYDLKLEQRITAGIPVFLRHRFVKTLSAIAGDALSIWDGSTYTDYIANKTEGRANDYWLDTEAGILYIRDVYRTIRDKPLRIKYRYGRTSVPGDITRLCTLMVCIDLAMSDDRSYLLPEGGNNIMLDAKVRNWQKIVDELTARRTELRMG